jgi:hypothetical protein
MTRSGAYTKPVPSMARRHDNAVPMIFTIDPRARRTARLLAAAGSGGATGLIRSLVKGSKTRGKPFSSSTPENDR